MDKKELNSFKFMPEDLLEIICILKRGQSSRKRRITRIGTHVFSLGRMIFARLWSSPYA